MNRRISISLALAAIPMMVFAQSAVDAYTISQPDMKGTARFMSMGGAFGALGADLSSLSQNPAGIGVYRSNDIGFTLDIDAQRATSKNQGFSVTQNKDKFWLNNIGIVGTLKLGGICKNLNVGFTYNKGASFSRSYRGGVPQLKTSLSNYIAGIANAYALTETDVRSTSNYDPYNPGYGDRYVPWSAILGYDSYLINPSGNPDNPNWEGQFGNGTSGSGYYQVRESGGVDEYNIALGGNFANLVYWGMNFGITSMEYNIDSTWGEDMRNAYVFNPETQRVQQMDAQWNLNNLYNMNGKGFNFSLGVIVKPIQELRLGLSFRTPTWYDVTENYYAEELNFNYPFRNGNSSALTNDGYPTYDKVKFATPWRVIASVAGVIGSKGIISFDYEWNGYKHMNFGEDNDYYDGDYDWGYPYSMDFSRSSATQQANNDIKLMYRNTSTFRIGAEYRVLPFMSVRAGYNYTTSPVTKEAKDNIANIPTAGTLSSYRLDGPTQYVTAGLGFRVKGFYVDAAYVWKHMTSDYYPFSPDPANISGTDMSSKLSFNNSQVVLTAGFRF